MKLTYPQWLNCEEPQRIPNKNWNFQYNGYSYRNSNVMRMTMSTGSTMSSRVHRKVIRIPSKRHPGKTLPGKLHSINRPGGGKIPPGKRINPQRTTPAHCDNSNDSGLGFDHHVETPYTPSIRNIAQTRLVSTSLVRSTPRPVIRRPPSLVSLQSQIGSVSSKDGKYQLQILAQPEQQHRARYQTEGSRGAVKDRSGNGFPIVKLTGYNKPAILEIFIGTDIGRVAPHMFYQACKVSGKNSTQCVEKKVDGTMVIEIELKPENDMTATCDCVGILKERNVDVEHRFPDQSGPRSKKKSTRCRMVFRTQLAYDDGSIETLQICSQQIICTQPPGVPEICKKSLTSCPAIGGLELFIIGKNFLKDTRVIFQARRSSSPNRGDGYDIVWEEAVLPDKEFLQQTHLVCVVPPYANPDINDSVVVQLLVTSSNKKSESHNFVYTPKGAHGLLMATARATTVGTMQNSLLANSQDMRFNDESSNSACSMMIWNPTIEPMNEIDSGMMPPPSTLPLNVRRPSASGTLIADQLVAPMLKAEIIDDSSQGSIPDTMNHDSMDRMPGSNENSLDGSPIKDLQFLPQRIRKHSIDIMDGNSMMVNENSVNMMMHDTNSMAAFPTHDGRMGMMPMDTTADVKVVDLRVKQEQIAAQIHQFVGAKAEAAMMPIVQNSPPFMTDFKATVNNMNAQVDSVAVALYANANSTASNDALFTQDLSQTMNNTTANQQSLNQSFAHNLMTEAGSSSSMNHILSYSTTSPNNANMMDTSSNSPLAQDVILNSTAATLNSTSNLSIIPPSITAPNSALGMSSDIILNPQVSPSMMCHNATDQNSLISPQVTSVLTCPPIAAAVPNSQTALLNNLMQPVQSPESIHISRSSPVAVKNMILNAAADILSSRPSTMSAETTIDALISLNSNPMLNEQQTTIAPMMINQTSAVSPNGVMMQPSEMTNQNMAERLCHNSPPVVDQRMPFISAEQVTMGGPVQMTDMPMPSMVTQQEILNQELRNDQLRRVTQDIMTDYQKIQKINSGNVPQESLLQAVALVRNELQQPQKNVVPELQMTANPMVGAVSQPNTTAGATIPQDITTMSDNDLIRYINPSCFDQV